MQQSNLSQLSCLSIGSKEITNNNQKINSNGTAASRMLHSLINEYDDNLNTHNTYYNNNNNTQSIPQQQQRQQYTIEQNYYKSNLVVMKISNNGQQIQDGQECQDQYQQQSSQRLRMKQNQVQRVGDDNYDNRSQNNNTNQNIQNTNNNNNNNNNNITNQNILQSYRSNMSIQSQSQLVQLMVKRQSQLKELQNFIMKQIQQINQSKQRNIKIKQCIAGVNNGIKQTRELYCESRQSIYKEMNQMREFMIERVQDVVVALINQHRQSTQVYIQQISDLRRQLQKKQMEIKRLQHRQQQRQVDENSINNNYNNKSNVLQHPQQQHLQLSFSADNTNNDIKQKQLINTILISQQQHNSNNHQRQHNSNHKQQHNSNSNLQQQQQLNMGWQNNNNVNMNRVRFQVQTSSIQQGTVNSRQQQEHQYNNNAQIQQEDQSNIVNNNKHKSLTHSESHSQSRSQSQQRSSPLNHHHYTNSQFNPTNNQQTSQVLRMNTMSFSMNNGNDQLSTINQLDVFDDNFNIVQNQNNNDDTQVVDNHYQQQRKSVIRSQGGGCLYSFKKNTHKRHVSGDDNFREQSVVDIKVDHCDDNNYIDGQNGGEDNLQKDAKTNTRRITKNKGSTSSVVIPKLPTLSSPSLINLHPVPLQQQNNNNQPNCTSSQTTKRRKSPHRYDYCRLYEQQQLREIQNLNDMCNNILLRGNGSSNMTKSNDIIQRNTDGDVIKMRLSQLKKDSYPSFSGSSSSNTPKLYHVGNHINNNNNLLMSSPTAHISSSMIGLNKSNNSPLHSNSHSHSRKKLTIEIPQSPNLQHNPSQHNPYYKIQNHVHQMSVQEFSPQRERLRDNTNGLNGRNISGRYQININDNQPYKQTTQSIKDRKEYIRSKIQNIKKKNGLSNNNNNNVINNNIYKDSQQYTNSKSPRVISFLKTFEEQQNTPSRVQLQRPSAVNRVGMMVTINNNNNNDRSLSNKDRFNNSNKQLQMQRSQQHLISEKVVHNNSRHADVSIKIKQRLQRQNRYEKSNTKGYDFTEDKLEKKLKQNNLSKSYNNNNNYNNSINNSLIKQSKQNDYADKNRKQKQHSFIYTREFSEQNSVHSNNNNIYQQLNHQNNNNNSKPAFNYNRNSNINNNTTIISSNTMSPLKLSTRNNNSLYLHQQQSISTKKLSVSQQYHQHHQQSKYPQQNIYTKNHPYVVTNDNERKKISTSINNLSNKKSYKNYQYQQEGDNLRRYDPVKSVAGFRRF